jgi:hypothetical protein
MSIFVYLYLGVHPYAQGIILVYPYTQEIILVYPYTWVYIHVPVLVFFGGQKLIQYVYIPDSYYIPRASLDVNFFCKMTL